MRVIALAVGLIALIGCSPAREEGRVHPGDQAPRFWSALPGQVVIGWILRGGDLIRCETEAAELRALQRQYGPRVQVSVVAVDTDSSLVASFFHNERLRAELILVNEDEFKRYFGTITLPALYVIRGDTVAAVARATRRGGTDSAEKPQLHQAVQRALHVSEMSAGSADPMPFLSPGDSS